MKRTLRIDAVGVAALWVGWSAFSVLAGWALSISGTLSGRSLAGATAVFVVLACVVSWRGGWTGVVLQSPRKWRGWRAVFALLWCATFLGGMVHEPSNIDALTYRLPRVLHWLDAGEWHWIETRHLRMNYSATAAEWLSAPLLAAGAADSLFLFNALSFALLPGLVFAWLRSLGASGRAARRWMWLTPLALGFALQAGSVGNDLLGAGYFLAAMVFAQRAVADRGWWFGLSALALALATNVKSSNLALGPMGAVFLWHAWRRMGSPRALAAGSVVVALAVSCLPTLVLNTIHTGHWTGDPGNATGVRPGSSLAALAGNAWLALIQNFAPPFFPFAGAWNQWADTTLLPAWRELFGAEVFPRFTSRLGELPQEEWAGLGLFVCVLLFVEWRAARGPRCPLASATRQALWAGVAGWLGFALAMGSEMPARLLAPFYFVPIAAVAVAASPARVEHRTGWRALAMLAAVTAFAAVVLTPARPLFPAMPFWSWAERTWPESGFVARASRVYAVYAARPDALRALREELQPNEAIVGFMASDDDSEWSLRQPLGTRRVVHVTSVEDAAARDLSVLVIRADVFWPDARAEDAALARAGFRIDARHAIVVKAARPPERWSVARRIARRADL